MNFLIKYIFQLKEYDLKSHIKVYYAYMKKWKPGISQSSMRTRNEYDKFAVAVKKCGAVVGHLSKGKTGCFAKISSLFLSTSGRNCYLVEVTGKKVNLGDGEGL